VRTIFIGDVHGCIDEFRELVDKLELSQEDRVVCLGDFMDRGPAPVACVRFARERGFESLLANHEDSHLRWRRHTAAQLIDPSYINPMKPLAPAALRENALLSDEDVAWMSERPVMFEEPDNGLVAVHGGLQPGKSVENQDATKVLRIRWINIETKKIVPTDITAADRIPDGCAHWAELWDGPQSVVYGHEPHNLEAPKVHEHPQGVLCIGIDTGCVYGGRLTALVVSERVSPRPSLHIVQVRAKRQYSVPAFNIPDRLESGRRFVSK
jgi:bis(5'-nucleosyl)-tetraphosphatase (symmetrical)